MKKKTINRNPVKQLFITFPKSNIDKVTFRDLLLRFEPDYYKIVEEKHKDGTPHLHAVIRFKAKYSKKYVLDYFKEHLPNDYKRIDIDAVRSIKNALNYLSKEDPNPLVSGEYVDTRQPKKNAMEKLKREFADVCGFDTYSMLERWMRANKVATRARTAYIVEAMADYRMMYGHIDDYTNMLFDKYYENNEHLEPYELITLYENLGIDPDEVELKIQNDIAKLSKDEEKKE